MARRRARRSLRVLPTRPAARRAPFCPNLIVHRSNPRLADDLAAVLRHRAEIVITSVGSPEPVLAAQGCRLPGAGRCRVGAPCREGGGGQGRQAGVADGRRRGQTELGQSVRLHPRGACARSGTAWSSMAGGMAMATPVAAARRSAATSPTWAPSSSPLARAWQRTPTSPCW